MMRLPRFTLHTARSIEEAMARMYSAGDDGMYVAGGTDLYPNMKRRQMTPGTVINLMRLGELRASSGSPSEGIRMGACQTLTELVRDNRVARHYPALSDALRVISTPLLRNMGTLGGNVLLDTRCNYYDQNWEWRRAINFCMKKDGEICWVAPSSPRCWAVQSSDTVPVLVALGAQFRFLSPDGERVVSAEEFYRDDGIKYMDKSPQELLAEIVLPPADPDLRGTYRKLRRRGAFDFPVLGVAATLKMDGDTVAQARIVLGALGSAPIVAEKASNVLRGQRLDQDVIEAAADAAYGPSKPLDNTDFAYAWRKQMVRKFVKDALLNLKSK
ncbi:MAG: 4-hydroxybenzoyl-CoA reductase [Armatimonadetes bacterium]|nr:4-hydroxybenzoyl-CoA reductase [Armatimonadota bacterium]